MVIEIYCKKKDSKRGARSLLSKWGIENWTNLCEIFGWIPPVEEAILQGVEALFLLYLAGVPGHES